MNLIRETNTKNHKDFCSDDFRDEQMGSFYISGGGVEVKQTPIHMYNI